MESSKVVTSRRGWNRATRRNPCPICAHSDWCGTSADGTLACCMRVAGQRKARNGGWLHRLGPGYAHRTEPPLSTGSKELAPIDRRNRVYHALLRELGLHTKHREHLQNVRGLAADTLLSFASAPGDPDYCRHIAERIIDSLGMTSLRAVPGFFVDPHGRWTCRATSAGILIPILNANKQIQAFQIRRDHCSMVYPRYIWFSSSRFPCGSSTGIPIAVCRPELLVKGATWITEGPLKATVAAWHLNVGVLGVPGVSNWRPSVVLIPHMAPVVIAYDMDAATKPEVAHHRRELARGVQRAGHPVSIAQWDPRYKGLDDAILANATVRVEAPCL